MTLILKHLNKDPKEFEPDYVVGPTKTDAVYIRLKDTRKISEIALDFEDLVMMKYGDDDLSLYSKLSKVYREAVGDYTMVVMNRA